MYSNYTKEDILRIAKEQNVRFIRLQFTDLLGVIKNVEIPLSQLEKALDNKMMFDGSSIEGYVRIEHLGGFPLGGRGPDCTADLRHLSAGRPSVSR